MEYYYSEFILARFLTLSMVRVYWAGTIQLRDECYTPQIKDAAPSPDLADAKDDAKVQKSDRSAIQDMLAFLFGE